MICRCIGCLRVMRRKLATQVSCHQDIAADSAFSFGMLAEFEGTLRERGAWWYPRLFWESGFLGQVLVSGSGSGRSQGHRHRMFFR